MITVNVTEEAGYKSAMQGLALSKKQPIENMPKLAVQLAPKDGGHNKFLESIYLWLDVRAPRYWWQEADTFRISTKQSESTMHTLVVELKRLAGGTREAFKEFIAANFEPESVLPEQLRWMLDATLRDDIVTVKRRMPEGFLQRRLWVMNYKCLRNIILQRRTHRLPHWQEFIVLVLRQAEHPELLPPLRP